MVNGSGSFPTWVSATKLFTHSSYKFAIFRNLLQSVHLSTGDCVFFVSSRMDIFHADYPHSEKSEEIQCCNFYDDDKVSFNIHIFFHLSLSVFDSLGHFPMFSSVIYHSHFSSIFPRNFLCAATDAV